MTILPCLRHSIASSLATFIAVKRIVLLRLPASEAPFCTCFVLLYRHLLAHLTFCFRIFVCQKSHLLAPECLGTHHISAYICLLPRTSSYLLWALKIHTASAYIESKMEHQHRHDAIFFSPFCIQILECFEAGSSGVVGHHPN